jgi:protein-S-isoprenylcysteine O-methyltransferase Ste14
MMSDTTRSWFWVLAQYALIILFLVVPASERVFLLDQPRAHTLRMLFAVALALPGVITIAKAYTALHTSFTPLPKPRPQGALRIEGVYKHIRHPMYVGLLLLGASVVSYTANLNQAAAWLALCVFFRRKAAYEESLLRKRYPEYAQYAVRTPGFIPTWMRW